MAFLVLEGLVRTGRKQGSRLGFPTINITVPRFVKKSSWGVYFSLIKIGEKTYPAVTHLGPPRTFSLNRATCESFLLTLHKDLYRRRVKKILLLKIRDVEKFPSVAALKKQIRRDVKAAKNFFGL
jgi:FAD synthase